MMLYIHANEAGGSNDKFVQPEGVTWEQHFDLSVPISLSPFKLINPCLSTTQTAPFLDWQSGIFKSAEIRCQIVEQLG